MPAHPDLTFDRFTPTPGVRRALALGVALAEETGNAPRLLLLHGPPGVGKTHLLQPSSTSGWLGNLDAR